MYLLLVLSVHINRINLLTTVPASIVHAHFYALKLWQQLSFDQDPAPCSPPIAWVKLGIHPFNDMDDLLRLLRVSHWQQYRTVWNWEIQLSMITYREACSRGDFQPYAHWSLRKGNKQQIKSYYYADGHTPQPQACDDTTQLTWTPSLVCVCTCPATSTSYFHRNLLLSYTSHIL